MIVKGIELFKMIKSGEMEDGTNIAITSYKKISKKERSK